MYIVNVDSLELQISEALSKLMFEEARQHAMSATNKVLLFADALAYKGVDDVVVHLFAALRRLAIEGQIASLCRDDYFVAADQSFQRHASAIALPTARSLR